MHPVAKPFQLRQNTINHFVSRFALAPASAKHCRRHAASAYKREGCVHTNNYYCHGPAVDISPCHRGSASTNAYLIVPFKHTHCNLFIKLETFHEVTKFSDQRGPEMRASDPDRLNSFKELVRPGG